MESFRAFMAIGKLGYYALRQPAYPLVTVGYLQRMKRLWDLLLQLRREGEGVVAHRRRAVRHAFGHRVRVCAWLQIARGSAAAGRAAFVLDIASSRARASG